jgi:nicotinate-nucleotide pyrophosphorylase (carboxylating)
VVNAQDESGLRDLVALALAEDLGAGDVTGEAVVPAEARARGRVVQKAPGVIFGLDAAAEVFAQAGCDEFTGLVTEGAWRDEVPVDVATVAGPARALLTAERVALNLLSHMSGVATLTSQFVEAARPGGAVVLDTRKTLPGLRAVEKAAVVGGGGQNHRIGLHDAILIKENHAALAGGIQAAVERSRAAQPGMRVEVEVRDAAEVKEALDAGADRLLLDNMKLAGLRSAVAARDAAARESGHRAELEASGGVSLSTVAGISETGVDFISVGALTHSAPALDLSLLVEPG